MATDRLPMRKMLEMLRLPRRPSNIWTTTPCGFRSCGAVVLPVPKR
jgi:hypothetical protein